SAPIGPNGTRQYAYSDTNAIRWWRTANARNQPYLLPNPSLEALRKYDYPTADTDDQLVDLMTCVLKAQALALETLVLDQTRPDVGVHVVKVVVPGIRHFWARFDRGRLYDVPINLGRLPRPLKEEDLNPVPV